MANPSFPDSGAGGDSDQYTSIEDDDEINDAILSLNSDNDYELDFHGSSGHPTSEKAVKEETGDVVTSFLYQRYENEKDRNYFGTATLESTLTCHDSVITDVGNELRELADEFEKRHSKEVETLVSRLRHLVLNTATAYPTFEGIACKLFEKGATWGRLVALLCFGYHMIRSGFPTLTLRCAFDLVVRYISRFICERVAGWIAAQGGWSAVLLSWPASMWRDMPTPYRVAAVATAGVAACTLIVVLFKKLR